MNSSGKPPPINRPSTSGRCASRKVSSGTSSAPARCKRIEIVGIIETEGLVLAQPIRTFWSKAEWTDLGACAATSAAEGQMRRISSSLSRSTCAPISFSDFIHCAASPPRLRCSASGRDAVRRFQPLVVMHRADHRHIGIVLDHGAQLGSRDGLPPRLLRITPAILIFRSKA